MYLARRADRACSLLRFDQRIAPCRCPSLVHRYESPALTLRDTFTDITAAGLFALLARRFSTSHCAGWRRLSRARVQVTARQWFARRTARLRPQRRSARSILRFILIEARFYHAAYLSRDGAQSFHSLQAHKNIPNCTRQRHTTVLDTMRAPLPCATAVLFSA